MRQGLDPLRHAESADDDEEITRCKAVLGLIGHDLLIEVLRWVLAHNEQPIFRPDGLLKLLDTGAQPALGGLYQVGVRGKPVKTRNKECEK